MKFIIAPDSYKGSLSATAVADAIEIGIKKIFPEAATIKVPIADGGEGTVTAFLAAIGGERKELKVTGPLGKPVDSFIGILPDKKTAIIEMAAASGLPLINVAERNPLKTTTYGTGELIKAALDYGCTEIILGIGGSATNDGGMGMAQALGINFLDKAGQNLGFGGEQLKNLAKIDISKLDSRLKQVKIIVACDVDNPLCGPKGASYFFGPQKGATKEMAEVLDKALYRYAEILKKQLGKDVLSLAGAGAAGGLGAGLVGLLNAELKPGIEIIIARTGLAEAMQNAQLVFTGEGKTDAQTAHGKAPVGIAQLAQQYKIPVICLSGGLGEGYQEVYNFGITACFSIVPKPTNLADAMENGQRYLIEQTANICRVIKINRNITGA